jgi:hypothetical protein
VPPGSAAGEDPASLRGAARDHRLAAVPAEEVDDSLTERLEQPAPAPAPAEGDVDVAAAVTADLVGGQRDDAGEVLPVEQVENPGDAQVDLDVPPIGPP